MQKGGERNLIGRERDEKNRKRETKKKWTKRTKKLLLQLLNGKKI